jgi:hypothetical protein
MTARLASRTRRGSSVLPVITLRTIATPAAGTTTPGGGAWATKAPCRLANPLPIEAVWTPDREAMVAALRVALDLPRQLPDRGQRGIR